jgi:hypothetical protein
MHRAGFAMIMHQSVTSVTILRFRMAQTICIHMIGEHAVAYGNNFVPSAKRIDIKAT